MKKPNSPKRMSDKKVRSKTGKTWTEWFAVLDKEGAVTMPHKDIALMLSSKYKVPDWWCQMVTVVYEQEKDLRKLNETATGYQSSVSKTFNLPAAKLYNAWSDEKERTKWLSKRGITITTAHKNRVIRAKWLDGKSRLNIDFYTKMSGVQMVVQHNKIASEAAAKKLKVYWKEALEK